MEVFCIKFRKLLLKLMLSYKNKAKKAHLSLTLFQKHDISSKIKWEKLFFCFLNYVQRLKVGPLSLYCIY